MNRKKRGAHFFLRATVVCVKVRPSVRHQYLRICLTAGTNTETGFGTSYRFSHVFILLFTAGSGTYKRTNNVYLYSTEWLEYSLLQIQIVKVMGDAVGKWSRIVSCGDCKGIADTSIFC